MGDGALLGAAIAYLTLVGHWLAARWAPGVVFLPEWIVVNVMGTGLGVIFEPIDLLIVRRGYLALPLVALALLWRPTRTVVAAVVALLLFVESARLVALSCLAIYVMHHASGLLSVPLAVALAALLVRWRRWSILASIVLTVGFCFGVGFGIVFQHDYPEVVSPLHRFVPIAAATLALALLVAWRVPAQPTAPGARFLRTAGVMTLGASCLLMIALVSDRLAARPPSPHRFLPGSSYEVFLTPDARALLWTDTEELHVFTDPYGATHDEYVLSGATHRTPQRIWPSPTGGVFVQMLLSVGWWKPPPPDERFAAEPAVLYRDAAMADGSPCGFFENPFARSVFLINQWGSRYFVFDRDSGALRDTGRFSSAVMGAWHATPDLASRRAYLSSALQDGGLYEVDLDSMAIHRRAAGLYLYETIVDGDGALLWGARPVTGEVIGVERDGFTVRHRFRTGFGSRDLQRDPRTGDLFTCSLFGEVSRVRPAAGTVETLGWCGRLCRNLFLDPAHDALWAATDDGICRFALAAGS
ncbi:MAG: hypothetical protein SF182_08650 [Deltaproteobacteria bacterium]|nr:hypothetical protein [Deltaproteobacteria bacterium]